MKSQLIPLRTLEVGKFFTTPDSEDGVGRRGKLLKISFGRAFVRLYARKAEVEEWSEKEETTSIAGDTMVIPLEKA